MCSVSDVIFQLCFSLETQRNLRRELLMFVSRLHMITDPNTGLIARYFYYKQASASDLKYLSQVCALLPFKSEKVESLKQDQRLLLFIP